MSELYEKVRPPIDDIRAVFAECEAREAIFRETGKQRDLASWKRHGGVLEVVCVGHMRASLDHIERLEAELSQARMELITLGCEWQEIAEQKSDLKAKALLLRGALAEMVYETTHLSPEEDDGSHWCRISRNCLTKARSTLSSTGEG